jgi:hypothetical protein
VSNRPILLVDQSSGKYARYDEHEGWMWTYYPHLATTFQDERDARTVARDKFPGRSVYLVEKYSHARR